MPPQDNGVRLCVVCAHDSLAALTVDPRLAQLFAIEPDALIELRLDGYGDLSPKRLADALQLLGPKRCLLTFRTAAQGGFKRTDASDNRRLACLAEGQRLGVFGIDLEIDSLRQHNALRVLWQKGPACRIASDHAMGPVPSLAQLQQSQKVAETLGADVVKLVTSPEDVLESEPILALLEAQTAQNKPLIALATGPQGQWSRLLMGRFAAASPWTYTCWPDDQPAALGQTSWQDAKNLYRIRNVTCDTPVFGVIGAPVAHSASPALHNAWFAEQRAAGIYLPLHLGGRLGDFSASMADRLGIVGLSVTHPLKQAAVDVANALTPMALATGAVNTLWRAAHAPKMWCGDNTDAAAALDTLERLACGPIAGRTVVVLGAGGAARAVATAGVQAGARVCIWARRQHMAQALAKALGAQALHAGEIGPQIGAHAVVVNCTPVGMADSLQQMPAPLVNFDASTCFFDTIYAPPQTAWLKAARAMGHRCENGMAMLEHQARAQFQRFVRRPSL